MLRRSAVRMVRLTAMVCAAVGFGVGLARGFPQPSVYPVSWELTFTHSMPKRIVVEVPGSDIPKAFWYMTYNVVNQTDDEHMFLPVFDMMLKDGTVIRSDDNIPDRVFQAVKVRERIKYLQSFPAVTGELRIGEDEARDGVAIWPETIQRMDHFTVFIQGLSGETTELRDDGGQVVKDSNGKPVVLRKSLQLDYLIRTDRQYESGQGVVELNHQWIMR